MASPKLLTVFGATGNQGGSVIDIVLSDESLKERYRLRGISRNSSSKSAQALTARGVEMVSANVNDLESLKAAVRGSHGVFGVTNFWDKDVMSKKIEVQQGKNIFEACKAESVKHYVFSSLPHVEVLTRGDLQHVDHFDGKAIVAEFAEANKGDMLVSYFQPGKLATALVYVQTGFANCASAMYVKSYKDQIRNIAGQAKLLMPFAEPSSTDATWPVIDPRADAGKYIVGLFEGGTRANGVKVQAVSTWTCSHDLLAAISREAGKEVQFQAVTPEELEAALPENVSREITETMLLVGKYEYYGKGSVHDQADSDAWLVKGSTVSSLKDVVAAGGPWRF